MRTVAFKYLDVNLQDNAVLLRGVRWTRDVRRHVRDGDELPDGRPFVRETVQAAFAGRTSKDGVGHGERYARGPSHVIP